MESRNIYIIALLLGVIVLAIVKSGTTENFTNRNCLRWKMAGFVDCNDSRSKVICGQTDNRSLYAKECCPCTPERKPALVTRQRQNSSDPLEQAAKRARLGYGWKETLAVQEAIKNIEKPGGVEALNAAVAAKKKKVRGTVEADGFLTFESQAEVAIYTPAMKRTVTVGGRKKSAAEIARDQAKAKRLEDGCKRRGFKNCSHEAKEKTCKNEGYNDCAQKEEVAKKIRVIKEKKAAEARAAAAAEARAAAAAEAKAKSARLQAQARSRGFSQEQIRRMMQYGIF